MVLLENLFSEPFTQWLSGPHFQKVPQLNEAVISMGCQIQQITCTLGPLILVRQASGVPPTPQPPSCLQALPGLCLHRAGGSDLSIYTLKASPSDQPLVQAGLEPPSWGLLLGWSSQHH